MYSLSRAEQEVIIRWDTQDRIATIDAADPVTIRKLDKLAAEHPDTYRLISEDTLYHAKRYEVASQHIRFGKPASEARRRQGQQLTSILRRETHATA